MSCHCYVSASNIKGETGTNRRETACRQAQYCVLADNVTKFPCAQSWMPVKPLWVCWIVFFFFTLFFFVLDQWQRWQGSQGIKRSQAKQTPTYGCHNRCCLERGRSAAEPPGRWSLGAELEVGWGRPRRMDSAWTLEKGTGDVRIWMGSPLLLGI